LDSEKPQTTQPPSAHLYPAEGRGGPWALGAALSWAVLVFIYYFFSSSHSLATYLPFVGTVFDPSPFPDSGARARVWGESVLILLVSLALVGATWSLGRRIRRWLSLQPADPWVCFAFDFGFGIIVLDLFWTGTGLTRLWFPPLWISLGAILSILFIIDLAGLWRGGLPKPGFHWARQDPGAFLLLILGFFYWAFSVLQGLAPETFYDSMVYHLAVPRYWLFHHGLADFPENFFSNYPYGAELYFLNGLVFQGTEAAKMLHVACFGACALLAGGWARETAGEKAGRLTLGLVLTFPLIAVNTWTSQVEGFLALATALFTYALVHLLRWEQKKEVWALATGLFGGLALSVKYTALLTVASALVVLAIQRASLLRKVSGKSWLILLIGGLTLLGPWALKNLCYTGNPVFPYLMYHFGGRHLPLAGYEQLLREQHARVEGGWWAWLALPWTLTMTYLNDHNFCGPLALALSPLLLLFRLRHPTLRFLAGFFILQLAAGLAVTHLLRFVLPAFIFLFVLLGAALAGGDRPALGKGAALAAGTTAALCFAFLAAMSHFYFDCAGVWSGRQTRADYLSAPNKRAPYFKMAQWVSANLPKDAGLLIVGDARGLYYERPFQTNSDFDEQALAGLARREKDAEGITRGLKEMGAGYLVVNGLDGVQVANTYQTYDLYDLTPEEWQRLDDFIQRGTTLVYQSGPQGVYQIRPELQDRGPSEIPDLVLMFSKPASHFIYDLQKHLWKEAGEEIQKTLELYPFSRFWKDQKAQFEKEAREAQGGI
jgi:hypothetical protein